jgi:hypothetical protein
MNSPVLLSDLSGFDVPNWKIKRASSGHSSDAVGLCRLGFLDRLPIQEAPEPRRNPQFFDLAICKIKAQRSCFLKPYALCRWRPRPQSQGQG